MTDFVKEVEVAGTTYVVLPVDAQTQYKILQKLARFGVAPLIAGFVKTEEEGGDVQAAFVAAVIAIIERMPEEDQDFCLMKSLEKTTVSGEKTPVDISMFTGRIPEFMILGARAIGVQLGDFSCFRSLIPQSTAGATEEKE